MNLLHRPRFVATLLLLASLLLAAVPARAQVTSLSMTSDAGDYIGAGQTYVYNAGDGNFQAQGNFGGPISIFFNTPNFDHWWNLAFAAPDGLPLMPGTYFNATRFPFQGPGSAGLDVSGDGRGCNMLVGSFTVREVVYGPDNSLQSFDATFEQHCEGAPAALRGQIRYNAHVELYLSAPAVLRLVQNQSSSFQVTATDAQGRHVVLSAPTLPPGASFVDLGNNTGTFQWTPSINQSGSFLATFVGDNQQGNQANISTRINVVPPPPPNDELAGATVLPVVPATVTQSIATATAAADDPYCFGNAQSVWFSFTPTTNLRLEANTFGSTFDSTLSVYAGPGGALVPLGCNDDAGGSLQSRVRFDATAGTTYHFMVANPFGLQAGTDLVFNVLEAPPPFSISPTLWQFGSVVPTTGVARLEGTVQCSEPAYVYISGQLKQVRGQVPVIGYWSTSLACSGLTPWTATAQVQPTLFKGRAAAIFNAGPAYVDATVTAIVPDSGEFRQMNLSTAVKLRGR